MASYGTKQLSSSTIERKAIKARADAHPQDTLPDKDYFTHDHLNLIIYVLGVISNYFEANLWETIF